MTLRISTAGLHAQGLNALLQRQQQVARTQQELVSGNKLQRAADDPGGMAQSQRLDHALATLDQHGKNAGLLEHRLRSQESALTDVGSHLTRARELAVQANSAALSATDRQSIAAELRSIRAEVLSIANRDDGAGRRLFAGTRDGVAPFADTGGTVSYAGDDGQNRIEVAPDHSLADTDPGSEVFLRVRTGDGVVRGSAAGGNTGSGVLQASAVTDHAAWNGQALRVEFTASNAYRVVDAGGAVLASGAYAANTSISAAGVQLTLTGAPATGDAFVVERAPTRDVFATLQNLADALDAPVGSPSERARRDNAVGAAISDLGSAQNHMLALRGGTGTRLAALDSAGDARSAGEVSLAQTLSQLRDVDYAEAASRLALQLTAMEAAQKTMLRVQTLSLFDQL
ncbi:flagellar hook-associated protein FlgL [Lysobacter koreensis]|uniref:Flagellar hook-associated protein FlgL n=1 Tax=Lysobacter koreensis TaxID=266122 RepID=A0ABW2YKQ2_9GAMM